jgi:hypothetical protein
LVSRRRRRGERWDSCKKEGRASRAREVGKRWELDKGIISPELSVQMNLLAIWDQDQKELLA